MSSRSVGDVSILQNSSNTEMGCNKFTIVPTQSINIYHHLSRSVDNGEVISKEFLSPARNNVNATVIF